MLSARRTLIVILIMVVLLLLGIVMVRGMKMMMMETDPKLVSMETGTVLIALLALLLAYVISPVRLRSLVSAGER
jgi:uncharacterized membrane protein